MIQRFRRRGLLGGIAGLVAVPALVRAESIMPVRVWTPPRPRIRARHFAGDGTLLAENTTPIGHLPPLRLPPLGCGLDAKRDLGISILLGDLDPAPAVRAGALSRTEITVENAADFPPLPMFVMHQGAPVWTKVGDPCAVYGLRLSISN